MRLEHTQPLAALRARRPAAVASAIFIAFLLLGVVTTVATAAPWNLAAWIGLAAQDANAADLAITKTASADTLVVGSPLTYTIVVANNGPITATGVVRSVVVVSPNWPSLLRPQHDTLPGVTIAQVWKSPPSMFDALLPATLTGVVRLVVVPSPSWPKKL